jgi:hypothetical protein
MSKTPLPGRHQGRRAGASQRSHPWPRMVEADRRHEFDDNPFTLPPDLELSVEDASGSPLFARSRGAPVGPVLFEAVAPLVAAAKRPSLIFQARN